MLFSVKLKADTEEGPPHCEDYQGGVISLILEAVSRSKSHMNEVNTVGKGECELCVCVDGRLFNVFGAQNTRNVSKRPQQKLTRQAGERETVRRLVSRMQSACPPVGAMAQLPGFAGSQEFLLVSPGETVSLQDKIRQSYGGWGVT